MAEKIGKYEVVELIGRGGMGMILKARDPVLDRLVALKFLHPELTRRTGLVQRFLQEAKVSAQIQSPHVVRVMDVDQTPDGLAFIDAGPVLPLLAKPATSRSRPDGRSGVGLSEPLDLP